MANNLLKNNQSFVSAEGFLNIGEALRSESMAVGPRKLDFNESIIQLSSQKTSPRMKTTQSVRSLKKNDSFHKPKWGLQRAIEKLPVNPIF